MEINKKAVSSAAASAAFLYGALRTRGSGSEAFQGEGEGLGDEAMGGVEDTEQIRAGGNNTSGADAPSGGQLPPAATPAVTSASFLDPLVFAPATSSLHLFPNPSLKRVTRPYPWFGNGPASLELKGEAWLTRSSVALDAPTGAEQAASQLPSLQVSYVATPLVDTLRGGALKVGPIASASSRLALNRSNQSKNHSWGVQIPYAQARSGEYRGLLLFSYRSTDETGKISDGATLEYPLVVQVRDSPLGPLLIFCLVIPLVLALDNYKKKYAARDRNLVRLGRSYDLIATEPALSTPQGAAEPFHALFQTKCSQILTAIELGDVQGKVQGLLDSLEAAVKNWFASPSQWLGALGLVKETMAPLSAQVEREEKSGMVPGAHAAQILEALRTSYRNAPEAENVTDFMAIVAPQLKASRNYWSVLRRFEKAERELDKVPDAALKSSLKKRFAPLVLSWLGAFMPPEEPDQPSAPAEAACPLSQGHESMSSTDGDPADDTEGTDDSGDDAGNEEPTAPDHPTGGDSNQPIDALDSAQIKHLQEVLNQRLQQILSQARGSAESIGIFNLHPETEPVPSVDVLPVPHFSKRLHMARVNQSAYAWLVSVLVAMALIFTGFTRCYLENPIFGADAGKDYLQIFLWALGSATASHATLAAFKTSFLEGNDSVATGPAEPNDLHGDAASGGLLEAAKKRRSKANKQ